jgi:hypothetical protein
VVHVSPPRHCEERSDEAIHLSPCREVDCFAALAMTLILKTQTPVALPSA